MVELAKILAEENPNLLKDNNLKAADFKGIANVVAGIYAPGKNNRKLRKRCSSMAEIAWDQAAEMVHSSNKNIPDAKICLLLTCSVVSIFENLFFKFLGFDSEPKCPECKSMDYEIVTSEDESSFFLHCNSCNFREEIQLEDDEIE